jgi:hypothetical protein
VQGRHRVLIPDGATFNRSFRHEVVVAAFEFGARVREDVTPVEVSAHAARYASFKVVRFQRHLDVLGSARLEQVTDAAFLGGTLDLGGIATRALPLDISLSCLRPRGQAPCYDCPGGAARPGPVL